MISKPEHLEEDFFEEIPITSDGPPNPRVDGDGENKAGDEKEKDNDIGIEGDDNDDVSEGEIKFKKSVSWSEDLVSVSPVPSRPMTSYSWETPSFFYGEPPNNLSSEELRCKMESVKGMLGRWSKRVGEATKKAEDLAENTWQHLKTGPSIADAALGRIAQGTKVLAEGGYEKIFHQTFETVPEEKLQDAFACYLSTSAGPVMGVLYVSTEKLAYCSDNPLSYKDGDTTEWSYYKVTIPLYQLKAVNPSSSSINPNERYIQVKSVDNHEFWFMGFLNYTIAENLLKEVLEARSLQSA